MNIDQHLVEQFARLFEGRTDAYGTDAGGCERVLLPTDGFVPRCTDHLEGRRPFGVYPVREDNTCKWGVIDIDVEDFALVKNLHRALNALQLNNWVERSRSKGYHVWVFAYNWVPAATVRRALLAACQLVDYTPKEVNPKQWSLEPDQLGNYVRLPYPELGLHGRQVILHPSNWQPLSLRDFVVGVSVNDLAHLEAAGELWTPPAPTRTVVVSEFSGEILQLIRRMQNHNRYGLAIFESNEPLEGKDRSTTLAHFAHVLAERGNFTPSEAYALLDDLDDRLGKFVGRKDREDQLMKLVERAYS